MGHVVDMSGMVLSVLTFFGTDSSEGDVVVYDPLEKKLFMEMERIFESGFTAGFVR
jgi:hypothetical protein